MVEASPYVEAWRSDVRSAGSFIGAPLSGPVEVAVKFVFRRPATHYVAGNRNRPLKSEAPTFHTGKPDLSKLIRAMEDALIGIAWRDDAQIAQYTRAVKVYGEREGMLLMFRHAGDA